VMGKRDGRGSRGLPGKVVGVAFAPDGRTLAAAIRREEGNQTSGEVRLWNADTGEERTVFRGHMQGVRAVAFSPDGRTVASAGTDRVVELWDPGTAEPPPSCP